MHLKAFDYQPVYKKSVLSNGVRVVTEHHPYTRATTAGVFLDIGSRDEPSDMNGLAHFIEHIVFKGTKSRSAYQLVEVLEAVGGELNAYTTKEMTCFHATTLREHLSLSLDVLADLVTNASCSKEEFEREREVIEQEIDMSADLLEEYVFDLYFEQTYRGQNIGRPILGTEESLAEITQPKLDKYYQDYYRAENMLVAVAGDVDHDFVVDDLEKRLGSREFVAAPDERKPPVVKAFKKIYKRPSEQVHLLLGGPSASFQSEFRFEAYLMNTLLGGGMTSNLYQKIREDKGWAYSVYSYLHSFADSGLLMVYAGTSEEKLPNVAEAIIGELEHLKKNGVSEKSLQYFKTQVKGNILLAADDIENRMNSIAVNELIFGRYRPVSEIIDEIEKVSQDSVQEYMNSHFKNEQMGAIVLGDVDAGKTERLLDSLF